MRYKLLMVFYGLSFLFSTSYSQNIDSNIISFFHDLISDSTGLSKYVAESELEKSNRLGITYAGVNNKFLISYDIAADLKQKIAQGIYPYKLNSKDLGNGIQYVSFTVEKLNYSKDFYFQDKKLISPITYFSAGWKNFSSRHFNFFISDTNLFNNYSITYLESYIEGMLNLLNFNPEERTLLEEEKIIYVLCKDNNEIKKVTGFDTRGLYILAYDEIVTTYNCHLHELSHLLINYKLKTLPLYTLAFFQEGFSVATGGRGGISRDILLDSGHYLHKTGFVPFNSIVTQAEFHSENASVTYPVSGFYSFYLLDKYGLEFYLDTYRKYSGNEEYITNLKIGSVMLPSVDEFETYVKNYKKRSGINLSYSGGAQRVIYEGLPGRIIEVDSTYNFIMRQNLLLSENNPLANYSSSKLFELFPKLKYNGEKYLITADKKEVNIYNLYTNILVDSYSSGLSFENKDIPVNNFYFSFFVNKSIFDDNLDNMVVTSF